MDSTEPNVVTSRPPSYAHLLIDSMDRYPNGVPINPEIPPTTSSNWRLQLGNQALIGYFKRLAITQIQFNWNLATIMGDYNDEFLVDLSGVGSAPITLTSGYYTPDDLATQVEQKLLAAFPLSGFTVVFVKGSFVISATDNFTIISPGTGSSPANLQIIRTLTTLGLQNQTGEAGDYADNSYVGSIPTMLPTKYIDICSSYFTKYQRVKDATSLPNNITTNVLARVYPVAPNTRVDLIDNNSVCSNPFTITIDYNTPKMIKWSPEEAINQSADFQLRDEFGAYVPWDIVNGCEYQMTLVCSES